jgi:uncharacterized protein (DUF1015 family)
LKTESLYIADGHHRTEALKLLSEENKGAENQATNHILSYLIAENNVKIYEFNRLVKDLNGLSKEDFFISTCKGFHCKQQITATISANASIWDVS